MRSLKINRLLPIYISILPLKFGVDIQSQTKVNLETKNSIMAARRPFWKWRRWKSIGSYPYIQVLCHLSLELIFKAKLKLESGNKTRQIWGIWKLRPAYSPETPNLGQNRWCFVPCDLEIWWMTLENNRASLLCCFKLCATFHSYRWIQTGVAVRKRPIWVKFDDF